MKFWRDLRAAISLLLAVSILCVPARALVTFNDSHDHVYVTGTFGVSHDSNVFASSGSAGDFIYASGLTAEYQRRAGWIGVNASLSVNSSKYGVIRGQDFINPSYSMELTKQTGRTTGSFTLSGARESRADSAVNLRSTSWSYNAGLNYKYPIVERFTLSGSFGYSGRKYVEQTQLANLSTYSASTDLFYVFTNERDLIAGYRYRYGETSRNTATIDHSFTGGVNGRIIRGINGSLRVGYQIRTPQGGRGESSPYSAITASGSMSYAVNRKITITSQLGRDFSTTAADTTVETTTATVSTGYEYSRHWNFSGSVGWGDTRFLGEKGRIILAAGPPPLLGANRRDTYLNWNASAAYSLNDHFKASLSYAWFENFSTVSIADFIRNSWSLSLSSRW